MFPLSVQGNNYHIYVVGVVLCILLDRNVRIGPEGTGSIYLVTEMQKTDF